MNPTEGEWEIDGHKRIFLTANKLDLAEILTPNDNDINLILLAPSMREELLKMEEAYNIVKELAEWSDEWNNGNKSLTECIDKLEEIDEKAKQFIKTTQHP